MNNTPTTKLSEDINNWIDAHIIASWATKTPKNKHYLAEWEDFKRRAEELEAEIRELTAKLQAANEHAWSSFDNMMALDSQL